MPKSTLTIALVAHDRTKPQLITWFQEHIDKLRGAPNRSNGHYWTFIAGEYKEHREHWR